jgi:hypothetical protein
MNSSVKEQWIAALESGEYKQGQKALRPSESTYCCLGVLCDLYAKDHPKFRGWRGGLFLDEMISLPTAVKEWADVFSTPVIVELMVMNDTDVSFTDIAAFIRENL